MSQASSSADKRIAVFEKFAHPVTADILGRDHSITIDMLQLSDSDAENWQALSAAHGYQIRAARDELPDQFFANGEFMARCPNMLVVSSMGAGFDTVDLDACTAAGVIAVNQAGGNAEAVAEHALGLMLTLSKRVGETDQFMRGQDGIERNAYMGRNIQGKTLGIIGMGRVGQTLARCARGFEMDIIYYNRTRLSPDLEQGAVYYDNLDDVLPKCDVLSLNCPVTDETRGFFNEERINQLSPGTIFVNTARGALVDEAALVAALKSGHIAAAGLDVYINEPGGNLDLAALPNTFLLPHIGSANKETRDAMGFRALDNLDAYFAGNPPGDRVA